MIVRRTLLAAFVLPLLAAVPADDPLGVDLAAEPPAALARDILREGDARRGAYVFHRTSLLCARCHVAGDPNSLGPDLARWTEAPTIEHLAESILKPSAEVREGYETATVALRDGRTLAGILASKSADIITLRLADPIGESLVLPAAEVEDFKLGADSTMPAGLVDGLGSRREFLDLVRYPAL